MKWPIPAPDEGEPVDQGRPHQAFVETEARKFRQEMETGADPAQPASQDDLAAAAPGPVRAPRTSDDVMSLKAVAAVAEYARQKHWVKPPYSNTYRSPSYVDALIQLADDAGWLAKEIPLPAHAEPHHPAIFYTVEKKYGFPCGIPKEDSLIHADYVHTLNGQRISRQRVIHPWPILREGFFPERGRMLELGWDACYTLSVGKGGKAELQFHRAPPFAGVLGEPPLKIISMGNVHFGPHPPS